MPDVLRSKVLNDLCKELSGLALRLDKHGLTDCLGLLKAATVKQSRRFLQHDFGSYRHGSLLQIHGIRKTVRGGD